MKEYTFEEVISNIKEGETYKCTNITFVVQTITRDFAGIKFNNNEPMNFCGINNEQKFIKIGRPVSFNEVLFSNRKCRVYYKKYDIVNTNRYDTLDNILRNIVQFRKECDLKELFIYGEWYLE